MTCSNENQKRNAGKMRVVWKNREKEKRRGKGHATPGLMLRKRNLQPVMFSNVSMFFFFWFSVLSLPFSTLPQGRDGKCGIKRKQKQCQILQIFSSSGLLYNMSHRS
jgi:hypothetical protein